MRKTVIELPRDQLVQMGASNVLIATAAPVKSDGARELVLRANEDRDGRSGWMWITLANGDLILGVFPHGDTHEIASQAAAKDTANA